MPECRDSFLGSRNQEGMGSMRGDRGDRWHMIHRACRGDDGLLERTACPNEVGKQGTLNVDWWTRRGGMHFRSSMMAESLGTVVLVLVVLVVVAPSWSIWSKAGRDGARLLTPSQKAFGISALVKRPLEKRKGVAPGGWWLASP